MKQQFVYVLTGKTTGISVQDVAFSRSEAREIKALYEGLYKEKYAIKQFALSKEVR